MRTDGPYSYIWNHGKPPPWRATRWAVSLAGVAILLFLLIEGATVELDPALRYVLSLITQLVR
jgi:hypothetical protein